VRHEVGDLDERRLDRALVRVAGDLDVAAGGGQRDLDRGGVLGRQPLLGGSASGASPVGVASSRTGAA
jgi:hypothetical protein